MKNEEKKIWQWNGEEVFDNEKGEEKESKGDEGRRYCKRGRVRRGGMREKREMEVSEENWENMR